MTSESLNRRETERLIAAAILAASIMNTQPWQFHAHGDTVDVRLDRSRTRTTEPLSSEYQRLERCPAAVTAVDDPLYVAIVAIVAVIGETVTADFFGGAARAPWAATTVGPPPSANTAR